MRTIVPSRPLRWVLAADAVLAAAVVVLHLALAAPLARWMALPAALLLGTGLFMAAWAMFLFWLARAARVPVMLVVLVVEVNLLWALASVGLLLVVAPTLWGAVYLVLNAAAVLAFAALQWRGLRRLPSTSEMRAARA